MAIRSAAPPWDRPLPLGAPAEHRCNPKHGKEVVGHAVADDALRIFLGCEVEARYLGSRQLFQHHALSLPIHEVAGGNATMLSLPCLGNQHHPLRTFERKRFQQHTVHDAKDGGIGSDSQRQREYSGGGKGRTLPQHSNSVANILQKSFHRLTTIAAPAWERPAWQPLNWTSPAQALDPVADEFRVQVSNEDYTKASNVQVPPLSKRTLYIASVAVICCPEMNSGRCRRDKPPGDQISSPSLPLRS